jgi:hypothetical protein
LAPTWVCLPGGCVLFSFFALEIEIKSPKGIKIGSIACTAQLRIYSVDEAPVLDEQQQESSTAASSPTIPNLNNSIDEKENRSKRL